MNFIKIIGIFGIFSLAQSQKIFMPNLPLVNQYSTCFIQYINLRIIYDTIVKQIYLLFSLQGEYRVIFEKIYPCESTANHSIKFNLYMNKKTSSITELKGNVTYLIPLDDSLTVSIVLPILKK